MSRSGTSELTRDEPLLRLEALAEEQAALRRVATLAAGDADARQLFDCVCEELGRVLGVESTDILRFEGDGIATVVGGWFAPGGPSFPVGMTIPVEGQTVTAKLYRTGRPQRVDDYSEIGGELAARVRSFGIVSAAGAPIMVAGRLWGGTMASSTRPHAFPEGTEQRIADFAELVTAALANADARDQLAASRARIVEAGYAERRRLGRDLHDGAQQELVGAVMSLRLARRELSGAPAELVDAALEQVQAGLRDLRELAAGIHPSLLTERGLGPALEVLSTRSPMIVERVEVGVRIEGEWAVVQVRDDGIGGAGAAAGTGLRGMADRVSALGGVLEMESPPGQGTAIVARLAIGRRGGNAERAARVSPHADAG